MGTFFELQYVDSRCDDTEKAKIAKDAQDLLDGIESRLSLYQSQSELSRLNRMGELRSPSPLLRELLALSLDHGNRTDGYFDVTVQPVLKLIRDSYRRHHRPPRDAELDRLRSWVNYRQIQIKPSRVRLFKKGMAVTLDGIAKGYAVDRVADWLLSIGKSDFIANFSGNMRIHGRHADLRPWKVAVFDPVSQEASSVILSQAAIASSGTEIARYSEDGLWHHLINPRTLRPASELASTTVSGPSAMVCDVLSTAAFAMGPRLAPEWIARAYPEYRLRLVDRAGQVTGDL